MEQYTNGAGPVVEPNEQWVTIRPEEGPLRLHVLEWPGDRAPFVLLHGLASNATTWLGVAGVLASLGHRVVAVDQRGHGRSDKPETGYDFATITGDLASLLKVMAVDSPVIAGQSWGGNVVLAFGARYPGVASHFVFVDGGFLDLQSRPNMTWERVSSELRPPSLSGMQRTVLAERIRTMHPDWDDEGIEATLGNFEQMPDGTIRPWLTLDRHMRILRALWDQRPGELYPLIREPVTIVAALDMSNPEWMEVKRAQVQAAAHGIAHARVHWFPETAHDIHVHRPATLAALMLDDLQQGF